jgi:hypothetical protein
MMCGRVRRGSTLASAARRPISQNRRDLGHLRFLHLAFSLLKTCANSCWKWGSLRSGS